jgi:hypothetical protein
VTMASANVEKVIVDLTEENENNGGVVSVKTTDCPHVATGRSRSFHPRTISAEVLSGAFHSGNCTSCKTTEDLWVCLACGSVTCGNHKDGHSMAHYLEHNGERTEHCLGMSCSDLKVWCHACDSYVKNDRLDDLLAEAEKIKNGTNAPAIAKKIKIIEMNTPAITQVQVDEVCELIRQSKHIVVFTGAGISTSAGLPDFRGPNGLWTCEKEGREAEEGMDVEDVQPTVTHRVIAKLVAKGLVQFVISQNYDNLHGKSGVPGE